MYVLEVVIKEYGGCSLCMVTTESLGDNRQQCSCEKRIDQELELLNCS